ncbi:hypothetical protein [Streptomyces sp. NPDC048521]|uniref:hypothetical protein n=1 Tax=Streptomyces sp. NPDC048521 TaxID=3365566 RepID=UPI00371023A3
MAKHPEDDRRQALCAWLTANGIDPNAVPLDADMTIDEGSAGRFLRCEVFDLDQDGRKHLDERGENVARRTVAVPLKVEPPEWWQPYQKPTRDQLLASVQEVRKLHRRNEYTGDCEHCSERDYPDYAVPHPCPTIRALDGKGAV